MSDVTNAEIIKMKVEKFINQSKVLLSEIDEINEWRGYSKIILNIGKIVTFFENVVITVESIANQIKTELDDYSGLDKLNAAVEIIDDFLDLPFWLELVDEYVLKIILSVVVHYLNEKHGHDWGGVNIE